MLVAMTDQNDRIVLQTSMPKNKLKEIRNERQFYCLQCKTNVQLKIGDIKIPHFAHLKNSSCENLFSEGETEQHLLGKEQLYQLFQQLGYEVELEYFIPNLRQRPDLHVTLTDGKRTVIEFQCSPISKDFLYSRNRGYLSENIHPIWIPCTPLRKTLIPGITKISLSEQLQQFVHSTKNQHYLLTYNPHQKQFVYFTNLLHLKDNQFLCKIQQIPLMQQLFPFYIPKNLTRNEFLQYYKTYVDSKVRFLNYRLLISRRGVNDLFLRSVYELRISLTTMTDFIGVPIKGSESLKLFAVEWQTMLFYFAYLNRLEVNTLSPTTIQYFLKWAKLDVTKQSVSTVKNYSNLLNHLNIQNVYSPVKYERLLDLLYTQFLAKYSGN